MALQNPAIGPVWADNGHERQDILSESGRRLTAHPRIRTTDTRRPRGLYPVNSGSANAGQETKPDAERAARADLD
jgi:hypothetical protein